MKIGDFVKVKKMRKGYIWYNSFGVLFTGLKGEVEAVNSWQGKITVFVTFSAKNGHQMCHFWEDELKFLFEKPVCKNILEPKQKPVKEMEKISLFEDLGTALNPGTTT